MIAYEFVALVVKTACLVVGIWTEISIGASCCVKGIVKTVRANIWMIINVSGALRTGIIRICRLRGKGQAGFCHVLSVQDPTAVPPALFIQ